MSAELKIREALAALKPEVLKPWVKLDRLPYLHATDDPKASPWGSPVVGRFDYMETADYIAACHPAAITELLTELHRLRATPAPGAPGQEAAAGTTLAKVRSLIAWLKIGDVTGPCPSITVEDWESIAQALAAQEAAAAPAVGAEAWTMPKSPKLFAHINSDPRLLSLLYDLNLLPEQIDNKANWDRMCTIVVHVTAALPPSGAGEKTS